MQARGLVPINGTNVYDADGWQPAEFHVYKNHRRGTMPLIPLEVVDKAGEHTLDVGEVVTEVAFDRRPEEEEEGAGSSGAGPSGAGPSGAGEDEEDEEDEEDD